MISNAETVKKRKSGSRQYLDGNEILNYGLWSSTMQEIGAKSKEISGATEALANTEHINEVLRNAVFLGLSYFGGINVVESIVYILEVDHSVNMVNIAQDLPAFHVGINKMFGHASYVVEERVCLSLAKILGIEAEGRTIEQLVEYVGNSES